MPHRHLTGSLTGWWDCTQLNAGQRRSPPCNATSRQPSPKLNVIKMFYNCGGERQIFACRHLAPIDAGLPPSSEGLPLSCEGTPPSSVLLPPCCVIWRGTRKRRHQRGITALWDRRPTLRDGRPALRDAIWRHGALWDGRPTLWDGRPTLCEGRPALRDFSQHQKQSLN